jgi:hypothetical protein
MCLNTRKSCYIYEDFHFTALIKPRMATIVIVSIHMHVDCEMRDSNESIFHYYVKYSVRMIFLRFSLVGEGMFKILNI